VKLRGLDNVVCKICQCAVLLKDKIIIRNVFGSYYILLRWYNTSIMLSIDRQFMLDEEKLQFVIWYPSSLTPWQIW